MLISILGVEVVMLYLNIFVVITAQCVQGLSLKYSFYMEMYSVVHYYSETSFHDVK